MEYTHFRSINPLRNQRTKKLQNLHENWIKALTLTDSMNLVLTRLFHSFEAETEKHTAPLKWDF